MSYECTGQSALGILSHLIPKARKLVQLLSPFYIQRKWGWGKWNDMSIINIDVIGWSYIPPGSDRVWTPNTVPLCLAASVPGRLRRLCYPYLSLTEMHPATWRPEKSPWRLRASYQLELIRMPLSQAEIDTSDSVPISQTPVPQSNGSNGHPGAFPHSCPELLPNTCPPSP